MCRRYLGAQVHFRHPARGIDAPREDALPEPGERDEGDDKNEPRTQQTLYILRRSIGTSMGDLTKSVNPEILGLEFRAGGG